jgi:hypothetical protein
VVCLLASAKQQGQFQDTNLREYLTQAKTTERATVQLIDAYLANHIALIASHATSVETEGDLTPALLLDFPIHLFHDVHPGCAFGGQGGKFNDHGLSQARPWLEDYATQQHEQRPACPRSTTHVTSSL